MNTSAKQVAAVNLPEPKELTRQESDGAVMVRIIQDMCANPEFDPAKMQQIINMRKEMFMEQARVDFNRAMALVQSEIQPVIADAANTQTSSRYSKLVTIVRTLAPIYTKHGFSVSYGTEPCPVERLAADGWFRITSELTHSGGFTKNYHVDLPLDMTGIKGQVNKTQIHGTKSAISYGRTILMGLMFNFTTSLDVDDDGNGAGKKPLPPEPPASDEQMAYIQDFRDSGQIPDVTEKWLAKHPDLTEKQAATVIKKLREAEKNNG